MNNVFRQNNISLQIEQKSMLIFISCAMLIFAYDSIVGFVSGWHTFFNFLLGSFGLIVLFLGLSIDSYIRYNKVKNGRDAYD